MKTQKERKNKKVEDKKMEGKKEANLKSKQFLTRLSKLILKFQDQENTP
jgi:hypothetical protein